MDFDDDDDIAPVDHYWCGDFVWITRHFHEFVEATLDDRSKQPWWSRTAISNLTTCIDCVEQYHSLMKGYIAEGCSPDERRTLFHFNSNRIDQALQQSSSRLSRLLGDGKTLDDSTAEDCDDNFFFVSQDESVMRSHMVIPLREVLMFPEYLHSPSIGDRVSEAISLLVQSSGSFSVSTKMPGLYLLLVHPVNEVQMWCMEKIKSLDPVTLEEYDEGLQQVVEWVLSVLKYATKRSASGNNSDEHHSSVWDSQASTLLPSHLYSADKPEKYWTGLCCLLQYLEADVVQLKVFSSRCSYVIDKVVHVMRLQPSGTVGSRTGRRGIHCNRSERDILDICRSPLTPSVTPVTCSQQAFWPALQCLVVLLDRLQAQFWLHSSNSFDDIVLAIVDNKKFTDAIKSWLLAGKNENISPSILSPKLVGNLASSDHLPEVVFLWLEPFSRAIYKSTTITASQKTTIISNIFGGFLPLAIRGIPRVGSTFCYDKMSTLSSKLLTAIFTVVQSCNLLRSICYGLQKSILELAVGVAIRSAQLVSRELSSYPECALPACHVLFDSLKDGGDCAAVKSMLSALSSHLSPSFSSTSHLRVILTPRSRAILSPQLSLSAQSRIQHLKLVKSLSVISPAELWASVSPVLNLPVDPLLWPSSVYSSTLPLLIEDDAVPLSQAPARVASFQLASSGLNDSTSDFQHHHHRSDSRSAPVESGESQVLVLETESSMSEDNCSTKCQDSDFFSGVMDTEDPIDVGVMAPSNPDLPRGDVGRQSVPSNFFTAKQSLLPLQKAIRLRIEAEESVVIMDRLSLDPSLVSKMLSTQPGGLTEDQKTVEKPIPQESVPDTGSSTDTLPDSPFSGKPARTWRGDLRPRPQRKERSSCSTSSKVLFPPSSSKSSSRITKESIKSFMSDSSSSDKECQSKLYPFEEEVISDNASVSVHSCPIVIDPDSSTESDSQFLPPAAAQSSGQIVPLPNSTAAVDILQPVVPLSPQYLKKDQRFPYKRSPKQSTHPCVHVKPDTKKSPTIDKPEVTLSSNSIFADDGPILQIAPMDLVGFEDFSSSNSDDDFIIKAGFNKETSPIGQVKSEVSHSNVKSKNISKPSKPKDSRRSKYTRQLTVPADSKHSAKGDSIDTKKPAVSSLVSKEQPHCKAAGSKFVPRVGVLSRKASSLNPTSASRNIAVPKPTFTPSAKASELPKSTAVSATSGDVAAKHAGPSYSSAPGKRPTVDLYCSSSSSDEDILQSYLKSSSFSALVTEQKRVESKRLLPTAAKSAGYLVYNKRSSKVRKQPPSTKVTKPSLQPAPSKPKVVLPPDMDVSTDSSDEDPDPPRKLGGLAFLAATQRRDANERKDKLKSLGKARSSEPTRTTHSTTISAPLARSAPFSKARAPVFSAISSSSVGDKQKNKQLPTDSSGLLSRLLNEMDTTENKNLPADDKPKEPATASAPVVKAVKMVLAPTADLNQDMLYDMLLSWDAQLFVQPKTSIDGQIVTPSPEALGIRWDPAGSVPHAFTSMDAYYRLFKSCFMLELLATVFSEVRTTDVRPPPFTCQVDHVHYKGHNLATIRCLGYIPWAAQHEYAHPLERDLVVISVQSRTGHGGGESALEGGTGCRVFGLVEKKMYRYNTNVEAPGLAEYGTSGRLLNLNMLVHGSAIAHFDDSSCTLTVDVVTSLSTQLRQWSGLVNMYKSRLASQIMRPLGGRYFGATTAKRKPDSDSAEASDSHTLHGVSYNETQHRAILAAVQACSEPYTMPRIILLQGPPGTGKTMTIAGFIQHFFESYKPSVLKASEGVPHILVCAPSNAGVDELARRVLEAGLVGDTELWRERYGQASSGPAPRGTSSGSKSGKASVIARRGLRMVRVGKRTKVHSAVQPFHIDSMMGKAIQNEANRIKKEEKTLQDKIEKLEKSSEDRSNTVSEENKRAIQKLQRQLNELRKSSRGPVRKETAVVSKLLKQADIVFVTLASSASTIMDESFLGNPLHFTCTVVDEAAQCCELDSLIPLRFGSSKVLLVGDHKQLPAVIKSQKAKEIGYGKSLFERIYCHLDLELGQDSPVQMLNTQYRMQPVICDFPSQQFYGGSLVTGESVGSRPGPDLAPFMVFDVQGGRECKKGNSTFNSAECDVVASLCDEVRREVRDADIGVITPYRAQQNVLANKLFSWPNIEIGTVDSFQGREKDVIILSCVRAQSFESSIGFLADTQRMNVALTRAKFALYVVCNKKTLMVDDTWNGLMMHAIDKCACVSILPGRSVQQYSVNVRVPRAVRNQYSSGSSQFISTPTEQAQVSSVKVNRSRDSFNTEPEPQRSEASKTEKSRSKMHSSKKVQGLCSSKDVEVKLSSKEKPIKRSSNADQVKVSSKKVKTKHSSKDKRLEPSSKDMGAKPSKEKKIRISSKKIRSKHSSRDVPVKSYSTDVGVEPSSTEVLVNHSSKEEQVKTLPKEEDSETSSKDIEVKPSTELLVEHTPKKELVETSSKDVGVKSFLEEAQISDSVEHSQVIPSLMHVEVKPFSEDTVPSLMEVQVKTPSKEEQIQPSSMHVDEKPVSKDIVTLVMEVLVKPSLKEEEFKDAKSSSPSLKDVLVKPNSDMPASQEVLSECSSREMQLKEDPFVLQNIKVEVSLPLRIASDSVQPSTVESVSLPLEPPTKVLKLFPEHQVKSILATVPVSENSSISVVPAPPTAGKESNRSSTAIGTLSHRTAKLEDLIHQQLSSKATDSTWSDTTLSRLPLELQPNLPSTVEEAPHVKAATNPTVVNSAPRPVLKSLEVPSKASTLAVSFSDSVSVYSYSQATEPPPRSQCSSTAKSVTASTPKQSYPKPQGGDTVSNVTPSATTLQDPRKRPAPLPPHGPSDCRYSVTTSEYYPPAKANRQEWSGNASSLLPSYYHLSAPWERPSMPMQQTSPLGFIPSVQTSQSFISNGRDYPRKVHTWQPPLAYQPPPAYLVLPPPALNHLTSRMPSNQTHSSRGGEPPPRLFLPHYRGHFRPPQ